MTTLRLQVRTGTDGRVLLELPAEFADTDLEIVVTTQPVDPAIALGYPAGFFEKTWGSLADVTLERPEQGEYEIRDEIE